MNETGLSKEEVLFLLSNAKNKDLSYERILSSMCTTPHIIAIDAYVQFIGSNMGDQGLFKGTCAMEKEVIGMAGRILNCANPEGYMTTGGTESNIQAIRSMRNLHKKKNDQDSNGNKRPNERSNAKLNVIVPESAHFSFDKVSDIFDIEIRRAKLNEDYKVSVDAIEKLIDKDTIGIVAVAGSTECGQVDPIEKISAIALENDLPLHIDAAFGGFVLPFMQEQRPEHKFDFSFPGVTSIALDPHKMGLSTIGSGILLFREFRYLESLKTYTPYLTISNQYTLTGTRSGASVAATFAVMKHLGRKGYTDIVSNCIEMTRYIVKRAADVGVHPVIDPVMNVVVFKVPEAAQVRSELSNGYNWQVSISKDQKALRLVIMPHMDKKRIDMFIEDLAKVIGSL